MRGIKLGLLTLMLVIITSCTPVMSMNDAGVLDTPVPLPDLSQWEEAADAGVIDQKTVWLMGQYARAQQGQSVDLDGDGDLDLIQTTSPEGVRKAVRMSSTHYYYKDWQREVWPDGRILFQIDRDYDDKFDVVTETFADGKRVTREDRDLNDKFELRTTALRNAANDGWEVVEEKDATEKGIWVETRRYQASDVNAQGQGTCDGTKFTPEPDWIREVVAGPPLAIYVRNPQSTAPLDANSCTVSQTMRLLQAYSCAFERLGCLRRSNVRIAAQLEHRFTQKNPVGVLCGNPCPNVSAQTASQSAIATNGFDRTVWRNEEIDLLTEDERCGIALHELIHTAGSFIDLTSHKDGIDQIYSCARYCGRCVNRPNPQQVSRTQDCMACAETVAERRRCGSKEIQVEATSTLALCHGSIGVNKACTSYKGIVEADCKGFPFSITSSPRNLCCASCPIDADRFNDKPCVSPPQLSENCSSPPECR
jgi:hypothetical protein